MSYEDVFLVEMLSELDLLVLVVKNAKSPDTAITNLWFKVAITR